MSDESEGSSEMPAWFSEARKSMMAMHDRMMNLFMNKNDSDDVDDIFQQVFDMRNDMSELLRDGSRMFTIALTVYRPHYV